MNPRRALSVIGLGKLGLPAVACFAEKGYRVVGADLDPATVEMVNAGEPPFYEPGLAELLRKNSERIIATDDTKAAVRDSDITFILVPTPSQDNGAFSNVRVREAAEEVGAVLRDKEHYHLVVLTSTVMPGTTGGVLLPLLEDASGKTCGREFGLCYSPEFVALGSVIHDVFNPDLVLIGESDREAGDVLEKFHMSVCDNRPPVARMNFVNAELAKIAVNTYITTKISFANTLARLCESLPGASVDEVTDALGLDSRIGRKYLKGAIGYGGPCFPRDNLAFCRLARQLGVGDQLASATDQVNRLQVDCLSDLVESLLPGGGVVGILGLSYKPDTAVVEESQGLLLAKRLIERDIPVILYDPQAMENARAALQGPARFADSASDCVRGADVVVITTPWKEFTDLSPATLARSGPRRALVDCWRILERAEYEPVCDYIELGVGREPEGRVG